MDVLGIAYEQFTDAQREAVVAAHPRGDDFKNNIIQAFYDGMKHRPNSTFGTVNEDVLALKDRRFTPAHLSRVILNSASPRRYPPTTTSPPRISRRRTGAVL